MDRFIGVEKGINTATALVFKIQYGQIYSIRSLTPCYGAGASRFKIQYGQIYRLGESFKYVAPLAFKIQYGQIYRVFKKIFKYTLEGFKIQYGQIYSSTILLLIHCILDLKSNMDRFIE